MVMSSFQKLVTKIEKMALSRPYVTAAVALTAIVAIGSYVWKSKDSDAPPALTRDEVFSILKEINDKAQIKAKQLLVFKQNIEQQIAQSGQQIEESEVLKQFILPHFVKALQEIEEAAYSNFNNGEGVLEVEFQEGVNYYRRQQPDGEDVQKAVAKLRKIFTDMGGDKIIDEDDDNDSPFGVTPRGKLREIPLEEVLAILEAYAEALTKHTQKYIDEWKKAHGMVTAATMDRYQTGLLEISEETERQVLEEKNLLEEEFQNAIQQYQNDPRLQQLFMTMQMKSQQIQQAAFGGQ